MDNGNQGVGTSWREYRRLILAELKRIENKSRKHDEEIVKLKTDMAVLKSKAAIIGGFWGFMGGVISAIIGGIVVYFITKS